MSWQPIFTLGSTGPTGPQGPQDIPSAFQGTSVGATGISIASTGPTGATAISSYYIITSVTGYIWVNATAEFTYPSADKTTDIAMYIKIADTTSNTTFSSIPIKSNNDKGDPSFGSISVSQRTTTKLAPGGYTGTVYAYASEGATSVLNNHCDVFALGNLS
jgi:hypothetical protein